MNLSDTTPPPSPSPPPPSLSTIVGGVGEWREGSFCYNFIHRRAVGGRWAVAALSLQHVVAEAASGYLQNCTLFLQRHLGLTDTHVTALQNISNIGPLLTAIILARLGGKGDRPKWLFGSMVLSALATFSTALTALLHQGTTTTQPYTHGKYGTYYCNVEMLAAMASHSISDTNLTAPPLTSHPVRDNVCKDIDTITLLVWVLATLVTGCGWWLGVTLGLPYLDDGVTSTDAPLYLAIVLGVGVLGRLGGVSLSSLTFTHHTHHHRLQPTTHHPFIYPPESSLFIDETVQNEGDSWWIGQLILASLMLLSAVVYLPLPRHLQVTSDLTFSTRPSRSHTLCPTPTTERSHLQDECSQDVDLEEDEAEEREEEEREERVFDPHLAQEELDLESGLPADERDSGFSMEELEMEEKRRRNQRKEEQHRGGNGEDGEKEEEEEGESKVVREILKKRYLTWYEIASGVTDLIGSLKRVLSNTVVLFGTLSDLILTLAVCFMSLWYPTHLTHTFRMQESTVLFYKGITHTASAIVGVSVGGVCVWRCGCGGGRVMGVVWVVILLLHTVTTLSLSPLSCDFHGDLPGVMSPDHKNMELHRGCSKACSCPTVPAQPVCLRDGPITLSFYSPCHAGCPLPVPTTTSPSPLHLQRKQTLSNCTCGSSQAEVSEGFCRNWCLMAHLYSTLTCLTSSLLPVALIISILTVLRSVRREDKALAMGVKVTVISLSSLLAPFLLPPILSSSCLVWSHEYSCSSQLTCSIYDNDDMAYKVHGVTGALFALAAMFAFLVACSASDLQLLESTSYFHQHQHLHHHLPSVPTMSIFHQNPSTSSIDPGVCLSPGFQSSSSRHSNSAVCPGSSRNSSPVRHSSSSQSNVTPSLQSSPNQRNSCPSQAFSPSHHSRPNQKTSRPSRHSKQYRNSSPTQASSPSSHSSPNQNFSRSNRQLDPNSGLRSSLRKLSRLAAGRSSSGTWTLPPMTLPDETVVEMEKKMKDEEREQQKTARRMEDGQGRGWRTVEREAEDGRGWKMVEREVEDRRSRGWRMVERKTEDGIDKGWKTVERETDDRNRRTGDEEGACSRMEEGQGTDDGERTYHQPRHRPLPVSLMKTTGV